MRHRMPLRPAAVACVLMAAFLWADFPSAQSQPVRLNGAIDKLQRGKAIAGAIMYDFSLYAARQFATSDLDFIILDMEHQPLDFERMQTFFLAMTDKAAIAKQGNLQVST